MSFSYGFLIGSITTLLVIMASVTFAFYHTLKEFEKRQKNEK
jgi:hypothetical protein